MSQVKATKHQVGISATALNNATLRTPDVPDGSVILSRGNADAPGVALATFNADGTINAGASPTTADNSTKAATTAWAKLGFVASIAATGYIKFPNWMGGLVIQWGGVTLNTTTGQLVSFPLAFPSGPVMVTGSTQGGNPGGSVAIGFRTEGPSSMTVFCNAAYTIGWIAIGY